LAWGEWKELGSIQGFLWWGIESKSTWRLELRRFLGWKGGDGRILGIRENGMVLMMRGMKRMRNDVNILGMRSNRRILWMRRMKSRREDGRIVGMREKWRVLRKMGFLGWG
jgi:hypothetical protein